MVREAAQPYVTTTLDEYLQREEASPIRHEYVGGLLYAQAGTSRRHNSIVQNIAEQLRVAAREHGPGHTCEVFISDVKLQAAEEVMYYPDFLVVCDPDDTDELIVTRPCLIVEVLSPSTESIDRREKLLIYRRIPSLLGYPIVHQAAPRVEWHWRATPDAPRQSRFQSDGEVALPCAPTTLSLEAIYRGVRFLG